MHRYSAELSVYRESNVSPVGISAVNTVSKSFGTKGQVKDPQQLAARIAAARGERKADLVLKGARWLDVFSGTWQTGDVAVYDGVIVGVGESYGGESELDVSGKYIVPGFIDAHVHIESSLMTPARFSEVVLLRGTTTALWDPHEIANVKGLEGLTWAVSEAERSAIDLFIMVPSCVPSTAQRLGLETSAYSLDAAMLTGFQSSDKVLGLAEMMNWPGLLSGDPDVLTKLVNFQYYPRDGHCPGLSGRDLNAYATAGISTCHESTSAAEGYEKLSKGIHMLIREGSCAKDADALLPLISPRSSPNIAFCSDDRNPLDIEESGHIDCIINKALIAGHDPIEVFRSASYSAALMYRLGDRGAVAPGYLGDLVLLSPKAGNGWRGGIDILQVFKTGQEAFGRLTEAAKNPIKLPFTGKNMNLKRSEITHKRLQIRAAANAATCRVIGVLPGKIVTDERTVKMPAVNGNIVGDTTRDVIKVAVFERHKASGAVGVALVQGLGLKCGAIATSITHDCHNLIVTGSSDELMVSAVAELCAIDGGIVVVADDGRVETLPLPIGGLMSDQGPEFISKALKRLKGLAREVGCKLDEPFLQLSFLALPVIPKLKVTDQGLIAEQEGRLAIVPVVKELI